MQTPAARVVDQTCSSAGAEAQVHLAVKEWEFKPQAATAGARCGRLAGRRRFRRGTAHDASGDGGFFKLHHHAVAHQSNGVGFGHGWKLGAAGDFVNVRSAARPAAYV